MDDAEEEKDNADNVINRRAINFSSLYKYYISLLKIFFKNETKLYFVI